GARRRRWSGGRFGDVACAELRPADTARRRSRELPGGLRLAERRQVPGGDQRIHAVPGDVPEQHARRQRAVLAGRSALRYAAVLGSVAPLPDRHRQVSRLAQDSRCVAQDRLLQLRAEELPGGAFRARASDLALRRYDRGSAREPAAHEDGERGTVAHEDSSGSVENHREERQPRPGPTWASLRLPDAGTCEPTIAARPAPGRTSCPRLATRPSPFRPSPRR